MFVMPAWQLCRSGEARARDPDDNRVPIDKMMQMRRWLGVLGAAREPHVSQKRCVDN
jgi:hypothetical protein